MHKNLEKCLLLIIGLIGFVILLSCSETKQKANLNAPENQNTIISESNTNQFDIAEFEQNKDLWTSKNIQNYKMIIGASGFMINLPEEVLIEVKNRRAKSIKSLSKTGKNYTEAYKSYDTIEKIFDLIERENSKKADILNVRFNNEFGYPTEIFLDERADTSDDELSLEVKSLEIEN